MTKPAINWTPANSTNYSVGRNAPIRYITFHHVVGSDDSAISRFQTANIGVSAHFVVGDTKITNMVALENTAWTNANWASNNECITIEHEGDWRNGYRNQAVIDNSAKLVAWLRSVYPNIGFNRHRQVSLSGTVCPADLPVEEIWNKATELLKPPAPVVVTPPAASLKVTDVQNKIVVTTKATNLWDLTFTSWSGARSVKTLAKGTEIEVSATAKHPLGGTYYLTEYSYSKGIMNGINVVDCTDKIVVIPPVIPPVVPPVTPPVEPPVVTPPEPTVSKNVVIAFLEGIITSIKEFINKLKG